MFLALFCAASALASDLDFTLVNKTKRSFEAVYVSTVGNKDWDGNLLADGKALAAGGQISIKFERREKAPAWDIDVVDSDGLAVRFDRVKLADVETVTLKEIAGKITAVIE